jgi:predicted amidophosphoribosyltransferase
MKRAEGYYKRYCDRRVAAGNCVRCGKPRGASKRWCDDCLRKIREYNRARLGHSPKVAGKVGRPLLTPEEKTNAS